MVAVRQGSLGQLRFVMKDGLQWLPLYGHYFYQHGCIYVRRGQFSQDKMVRGLEYLRHDRIRVGVETVACLVFFPSMQSVQSTLNNS